MKHTYIEEHHLVDRYVMGRLSAPEAERFEEHFLACDTCLDQLQRSERMVRGLKRAVAEDVTRQQLALVSWLARLGRLRQLGVLAVAGLLLVALPSLLWRQGSAPIAGVQLVELGLERSSEAEAATTILLARKPRGVVLVLWLDESGQGSFRAVLRRMADGTVIWSDEGIEPDTEDRLAVSLPPGVLTPGDYQLEATSAAGGLVVRRTFRVSPPS